MSRELFQTLSNIARISSAVFLLYSPPPPETQDPHIATFPAGQRYCLYKPNAGLDEPEFCFMGGNDYSLNAVNLDQSTYLTVQRTDHPDYKYIVLSYQSCARIPDVCGSSENIGAIDLYQNGTSVVSPADQYDVYNGSENG